MKYILAFLFLFSGIVNAESPAIRVCTEIAEFIESAVVNRDAGLSLEKALELSELTTPDNTLPLAQVLIRAVYDDPFLNPKEAYSETFIGCLAAQSRIK